MVDIPLETLDTHLTRVNKSTDEFADEIKKPRETVRRWRKHLCHPRRKELPSIEKATAGHVRGESFFLPLNTDQKTESKDFNGCFASSSGAAGRIPTES